MKQILEKRLKELSEQKATLQTSVQAYSSAGDAMSDIAREYLELRMKREQLNESLAKAI